MVRLTLTVLAMSVCAMAATTHNVRAEPDRALYGRADNPQVDQIRAQMSSISPPLASAEAALKDARKQAKEAIPKDKQDAVNAAKESVKNTFDGLPQDQKDQLKAAKKDLQNARKAAKASANPANPPPPAPSA